MSDSSRTTRKLDHLKYALQQQPKRSSFADVQLWPCSLPELNLAEIKTECRIWGRRLKMPLLINAMTGGHPETLTINKQLAQAAAAAGIGMAVGSQRAALNDPSLEPTFRVVREAAPEGLVLANLSAAAEPEDVQRAVDMLSADAVQLFLNVPQELFMAEGERSFRGLCANIAQVCAQSAVPVIIKDVGFGLSSQVIERLWSVGVRSFDIGGSGGTDFLQIERQRAANPEAEAALGWGIPTAAALLEAADKRPEAFLIAAGGICSVLDMAKALAMGADLVGVAGYFLRILLQKSAAALQEELAMWQTVLPKIMLLCGTDTIAGLKNCPFTVSGDTAWRLQQRGVELGQYARRGLIRHN